MKSPAATMSVLRPVGASLRRLRSDLSGEAILTYAIIACLLAAALVVGTSVWQRDALLGDRRPAVERSR